MINSKRVYRGIMAAANATVDIPADPLGGEWIPHERVREYVREEVWMTRRSADELIEMAWEMELIRGDRERGWQLHME